MTRRRLPLCAIVGLALSATACATGEEAGSDAAAEDATALAALPAPEPAPPPEPVHQLGVGTELQFSTSMTSSQRAAVQEKTHGRAPAGIATVDLNGDGTDEMIALARARPFCGAGGVCNLWIFQAESDGWRQINTDSDAAKTAYLLPSSTNGYRDLEVTGGCTTGDCNYLVAYDGAMYHWVDLR